MKKFATVASTLALLAGLGLPSAPASAESLYDAMAQAYMSNPTLRAARAGQRATDEYVPQALSGWRPTVSAGASIDESYEGGTTTQGVSAHQKSTNGGLSIELDQPVFSGFKTINGTKAAKAQVAAGQQQLLATEQDVLFAAAQAYAGVIRDRAIVGLRRKNVSVLQEQLRATNERFNVGEVTKTDVAQARAAVAAAQATMASAQASLAASTAAYLKVVGSPPGTLKYPKPPKLPASLEAALSTASETNPSVLAAALVEEASVHEVEVEKANLLPSVSLQAKAGISDDLSRDHGNKEAASIAGVLSVPLYEGGYYYSTVRQAKQTASQRRIQVIESNRAVREAVAVAWNSIASARETTVAAKSQVSASQLALEGVRQEYAAGSRTTLDVLNAEADLFDAQVALVNAEHDAVVFTYQLLASMGHLTADHLKLAVERYDPTENYDAVRGKWIGTDAATVK